MTLILGCGLRMPLFGQIACNPLEPSGKGEWTVSLNGTYLNQTVGQENALSRRILLKSGYGMTPWLDLYVLGGAVDLEMKTGQAGIQDYDDKYRPAFGAGAHVSLSSIESPVVLFGGAQFVRFVSRGSYIGQFQVDNDYFESRYSMRYDWREFKAQLGLAFSVMMFRFYGAYTQWGVQRLDRKKEYLIYQGSSTYVGMEEGEYRSGMHSGILAGMQINFPGQFALTLETLIFDKDSYHILAGISQTGNQGW